jgi:hypothetical protein
VDESAEKGNFKKRISGGETALPMYGSCVKHRVEETLVIGYHHKAALLGDVGKTECPGLEEQYAKESARPAPDKVPDVTESFFSFSQ